MEVTETLNEGLKREFKITVPAADIDEKMTTRLTEIAKSARLPGFRPGKVPVSLLRKTHGKAVIGEVLEKVVSDSSQATMSERGLRPVMQPNVEITDFEEGNDLHYTMAVELFPEIELIDFAKIKLERLEVKSDDQRIAESLEQIAKSQSETQPVEKKRKCQNGDVVMLDFVGTVDGEEFAGGKAEDYGLELGLGTFVPGFEEQIVGSEPGDHLEVKVTFPEDYSEALAGKAGVFAVDIKEIREKVPVPIDDELAKKVGAENLTDLKKKIGEEHKRETVEVARIRLKRDLLDILEKAHDFELPPGMVEQEFQTIWQRFEHERKNHPDNIDADDMAKSEEELQAEYGEIAKRRVRLGLLLSEIGSVNGIDVAPEELNQAITREARRYPGREQETVEYYQKNPEAISALQGPLLEDKVIDFILELADISVKEVALDELFEEPAAKEEKKAADKSSAKKTKAKKAKEKSPEDEAEKKSENST